jgi:hypothetical protein
VEVQKLDEVDVRPRVAGHTTPLRGSSWPVPPFRKPTFDYDYDLEAELRALRD